MAYPIRNNNKENNSDDQLFADMERPQCFCGKVATTIYPIQASEPGHPYSPGDRGYSAPLTYPLSEFDFSSAYTVDDEFSFGYQKPFSYRRSSRISNKPPPEPPRKKPPTSKVVFECHFTTPQESMTHPEVCAECEDQLRRPNERELDSGFEMFKRLKGQEKEEGERNVDEVDSWPMVSISAGPAHDTEHQDGEDSWSSPVYPTYNQPNQQSNLPHFVSMPSLPPGYKLPEPRKRKVCGFHMHALEWYAMQDMSVEEQIVLTRTADCPVFSQSVTRWLDCRPNDLELAPFNDINCFCMEPMVIRLRKSSQGDEYYEFACVHRVPLSLRPVKHWNQPDDSLLMGGGCSRVILLKNAAHTPRTTPVHKTIKDTPWRQSILAPLPPSPYSGESGRKKGSILKVSPHPIDLRRAVTHKDSGDWKPRTKVGFKRSVEEIIPLSLPDRPTGPVSIPEWYDPGLALQLLDNPAPYDPDDWPRKVVEALNASGAGQVSDMVIDFLVEEAIEIGTDFAASIHEKKTYELEAKQEKLAEMERNFEQLEEKQKQLAQEAKMLQDNGKEMQRFRCRICWDANSTHAAVPCFHLVSCESCIKHVTHCGICRTPIQGVQLIKWG